MIAEKLVVIGLDGAHFELITPWIEDGILPHIEQVMREGISSTMEACLPPVTSPNWKCYSTGKNPGKLGIFWWRNVDKRERKVYFPIERKNQSKELWDYLGDTGYKVCVINTPLTYPPKKINGIMISGGPDAAEKGFTYPRELEKELKERYGYRVHPKHSIEINKDQAVEEIFDLIKSRFEVALDLLDTESFDFVQITTFYLNVLHHFFWDQQPSKKAWKLVDTYIGKLLEREENIDIIFMSDHGSNKIETVFNINTWLHKEGYLKYNFRYRRSKIISKLGITLENLKRIAEALGIKSLLSKGLPQNVRTSIPRRQGEMKKEEKADKINWEESNAFASNQGPVYILNDKRGLKEELKEKLEAITNPEQKKVIKRVYEREEIYAGDYLKEAPDLIVDQARNVYIKGSLGKEDIFEVPGRWRGENKREGLFIGYGPDFKVGTLERISILDLVPTILTLYGKEIPEEMDGEARAIFNEESKIQNIAH
ncbi:MAG: nucleotide pyrophosphatase [Candidatus Korarchaeota archaeon]|nr:nucleotide pyrophosphatase [Candidatus Korarchaeota archaeon]NIU83917.1 nucleotide pyrophosphatase [Candidatus Thorarchaeota archaeon]NIW14207.1 nucleotide pyrophosphatase [Candidatus Thorarchaeota archaeon]NIW52306.1 nucleotide pyrophosphatase [Candidatus Korarchaeota archaeon]